MSHIDAMSDVIAGLSALAKFAREDPRTYERAVSMTDSIGLLRLIYENRDLFNHIAANPAGAARICAVFEQQPPTVVSAPAPMDAPVSMTAQTTIPTPTPDALPARKRGRRSDGPTIEYVYFISAVPYSGSVKIGRSWDPIRRIDQLKTARDDQLRLSAIIPTYDASALEKELHQMHAARRTNGEWFSFTKEELSAAIADASSRTDAYAEDRPRAADGSPPSDSSLLRRRVDDSLPIDPPSHRAMVPHQADVRPANLISSLIAPSIVPRLHQSGANTTIIMGQNVVVNTATAKPLSAAKQRRQARIDAVEAWVEANAPGFTEPSGTYYARCLVDQQKPHLSSTDFTSVVERVTGMRLVKPDGCRGLVWRDPAGL